MLKALDAAKELGRHAHATLEAPFEPARTDAQSAGELREVTSASRPHDLPHGLGDEKILFAADPGER